MAVSGRVEKRGNCVSPPISPYEQYAPKSPKGRDLWVLAVRSLAGEPRYGGMILGWDISLMRYSSSWGLLFPT